MARPARHSGAQVIEVTLAVPAGISRATLHRWTHSARRRLPRLRGPISVVAVSPGVSRGLNATYRHFSRPTNVLSFFHHPTDRPHEVTGEIVLCPAVIRREARQQRRDYRQYLQFLLQHGCLHLLGLDHQTSAEQRRWRKWERRLATQSSH